MRIHSFVSIILLCVIFSSSSHAAYYLRFLTNHHESRETFRLAPEFTYYNTDVNFNRASKELIPAELDSYSRTQFDFNASYGLTHSLSLFADLSWGRVDLKRIGGLTSNAYGFGDQLGGAQYRVYDSQNSGISVDLLAQVEFPLYDITSSTADRTPFLGDASTDMTGAALLQFPIDSTSRRWWLLNGGAGYTYRTQDFSGHIPWMVYLNYQGASPGPLFSIGWYAITSLKTDPAGKTYAIPRYNRDAVAGGSNAVQATNPTLHTLKLTAGYMFSRSLGAIGTFSSAVAGTNAPKGMAYGAALQWVLGGNASEDNGETSYAKSNRGFITYDFEATVSKVNDRLNLIKINKGKLDGIRVGQSFDIFQPSKDGKAEQAVGRGKVLDVLDSEAAIKILEFYKEVWIEEGFVARRTVLP